MKNLNQYEMTKFIDEMASRKQGLTNAELYEAFPGERAKRMWEKLKRRGSRQGFMFFDEGAWHV